jgi:hypothetical protein
MELILSEEQYSKFYNILKEQPTGLVKNIASVLTKSKLNRVTMSKIQDLITKKKLSSPLPINKINTSRKIINRLVKGELNPQDTIKVLKVLFKNETSNKELLESIANYIVKNDQSIVNFKGKSKEEIISILKPKYGDEQSKILADKIYKYNYSNIRQGLNVLSKGYREGWNAPSLLKGVLNWNKLIPEYNAKGWVLFTRWLFTGTTRNIPKGFQQIKDTLVKQGVGEDFAKILAIKITSVGVEVFKRWIILNGVVFLLNQVISYFREMGGNEMSKRESTSLLEDIVTDMENNWGKFGPRWVWPVGTVAEPIFTIVRGILKRETPSEIYEKMKSGSLPEQKELETLNNEIENSTLEKPSLIDKGELMIFKRRVKLKYPNFKYLNNIKIIDGVPYFVYKTETYPIYDYNSEYYVKHNGDVIYLDDLTE